MTSTANSQSVQAQDMGTGIWTFYAKTDAPEPALTASGAVDITTSIPSGSLKLSECLKRCASDSQCAGANYAGGRETVARPACGTAVLPRHPGMHRLPCTVRSVV